MDSIPLSILEEVSILDGTKRSKSRTPKEFSVENNVISRAPAMSKDGKGAEEEQITYNDSANAKKQPASNSAQPTVIELVQPSKPSTRKEVALLRNSMLKLLSDIGAEKLDNYPTEMHSFVDIIQTEQQIYDKVFHELIRQVSVNMFERGEILQEIRKRYSAMFVKIPKHILAMHTELIAQRKLNKRLSEELVRSKETIKNLASEIQDIKITAGNEGSNPSQPSSNDEALEEYHKLYKMQRDRLEDTIKLSEQEKRVWIDAATCLATRMGSENNASELSNLQKHEQDRMRATCHIMVRISETTEKNLNKIERKVNDWRVRLTKLSTVILEEDRKTIERLNNIQKAMKIMLVNISANEGANNDDITHPLIAAFYVYDLKSVVEYLSNWNDALADICLRFTSDRDRNIIEEIILIQKLTSDWISSALDFLSAAEKSTNGRDYIHLRTILDGIKDESFIWLKKLENRVTGEDSTSQVMNFYTQIEDKYSYYSSKESDKPLGDIDRTLLKDALKEWIEFLANLISICKNNIDFYSINTEKDEHKVPLHIENWKTKLIDHVATDSDIRNEDNTRIHTSMISWMIKLLVNNDPSLLESSENELHMIYEDVFRDLNRLNEMTADEGGDLRARISGIGNEIFSAAKRLLIQERDLNGKGKSPKNPEL